jgi:alkylation response protein AidB-like acyl-CoA dehydrogenase
VGANAISESEAGSDVFALQMTARRAGDDWLLNGVKSYVTNGPVADVMLVYASTNPAHRWLGISAFAVDSKSAGLRAGQPFAKVGLHSAESGAVYFDDVRVPAHRLLGAEGQGAAIFQASMAWERACLFAAYLGSMARDLDKAVAFAQERKQFGKAIGKYQAIAHKIADMKLRLECARMMLWRACWKKDRGLDASVDISLAKLAVSEAAVQSGLDVIHIHGSLGVSAESRVAESLMDALPATIFSGTSEMQREIVARGLGL